MVRKRILSYYAIITLLGLFCSIGAADCSPIVQKRAQLYLDNAYKAELSGNLDEAFSLYEEAASLVPNNVLPKMKLASLFTKIGMYTQASRRLDEINLDLLSDFQKAEVYFVYSQIAISKGSAEEAASATKNSLKFNPENIELKILYSALNHLLGFKSKSEELLQHHKSFSRDMSSKALLISFLLDLNTGNLSRAYKSAGTLAKYVMKNKNKASTEAAFTSYFLQVQPIYFITFMPLALNGAFYFVYSFMLFCCLGYIILRLSTNGKLWQILAFAIVASSIMLITQHFFFNHMFMEAIKSTFSPNNNVWIAPKLLLSLHFISLALFAIFPMFRILPEKQRPQAHELYGIWFFCLFFMIFICSFQGRIDTTYRFALMSFGAFFALLTSVSLPMGKFIMFKLTSILGLTSVGEMLNTTGDNSSPLSLTEARILQTNSFNMLIEEKFDELIIKGKKILQYHGSAAFPILWQNIIFAMIYVEDFESANKNINGYLEAFAETSHYESGLLYQALLKSKKGDFATALKIIKSFPDNRVKGFTNDETAICLLILGCCGRYYKEFVQAHIDLGKAINFSKLPILKAESLLETTELDYKMNAKVAMQKWAAKANTIKGGPLTTAYCKTVLSMFHAFENDDKRAFALATEATSIVDRCSKIYGWHGHLLNKSGKHSEAEALLSKMTPGTYSTDLLIAELTDNEIH